MVWYFAYPRMFLLFSLLGTAAFAQDNRLVELSRLAAPRFENNRVPSAGERLGQALGQTQARLEWLEARVRQGDATVDVPGTLREERQKLLALDEAFRTEFTRIESRLKAAGVPADVLAEKLKTWHEFTGNYRERMTAAQGAFDRVCRAGAGKDELAKLRELLGGDAVTERPSRIADSNAPRLSPRLAPSTTAPALATDPPTPDDLAQTKTVLLAQDIVAKAAAYGKSPSALFAYVYNEIQFAPYYMLVQNSESVLWSGKGNDADQATLLIALLRASGIPARYVMGHIPVPVADAINWTGAKDVGGATLFLNLNTVASNQGIAFDVLHVWVEAWLPTPAGNAWIPMTPSIKHQTFQAGLSLARPVFDRTAFLSSVQTPLASEVYAGELQAAFQKAYPGHDFSELPYAGTITPISATALPAFPYTPTKINTRASSLPEHTMGITLTSGKTTILSASLNMPEVSQTAITMGFIAASQHDQQIIDSFGGLANTPVGMVNLLPQVLLDGVVMSTGSQVSYGGVLALTVTHTEPFATSSDSYQHNITAGEDVGFTLGYNQISEPLIASRVDRIESEIPTASPEVVSREILSLAGLRYFQRIETEKQRVFLPLQIVPVLPFPEECATYGSLKITSLFDRPFLATPGENTIDAPATAVRGFDLNAGGKEALSVPNDLDPSRAAEAASSGLENELWEELVLIPSVSTIKALQIASQDKIPQVVLNLGNARALLQTIQGPQAMLQTLAQDIQAGATITISQKPVNFGVWTGFGWIAEYSNGFSYIIYQTNSANGGTDGGNPPQPQGPNPGPTGNNQQTNGTNCSDPVNVSNGNMFRQETDLRISSRGPATVIQRTYNSLSSATNGPFGFGWAYNYGMSLKDNQTSVTLVSQSGGIYTFSAQGGSYGSPAGLNLTLSKDAQGYTLKNTHGTQWRFDIHGVLQSITDRNQNATKLAYDGSGHLTTITDALNRVVTLGYDGSNHITEIEDFTGRKVIYSYDATGNLISVSDPANNRTSYVYYTASPFLHLLQKVTKPAGNWTSFEYFANQQAARVSDSAGRNMRFFYLPMHNETMFVDPRGFTWSYYYNAIGNVTQLIKGDGNSVNYTFTPDAKLASITDEEGYTTAYTYDAQGNVTSVTDPLGSITKLTYEPNFNRVASVTNPKGEMTSLAYDAHGNWIKAAFPLGVTFSRTYDMLGELLTATDPEGNTVSISYDSSGNPQTLTDPLGHKTQFQYDNLRRLTEMVDALGDKSSAQHDVLDRLVSVVNPVHSTISAAYDANGNLAQSKDPNGNATKYGYDALDHVAQVTDPQGKASEYGYSTPDCGCSTNSDLITFRDAANVTQTNDYDLNERVTQVADAAGNLTTFLYNGRGDLTRKTDANGNTIQYQYDADRRLIEKDFPDGSKATFAYDVNGNLTRATNANTSVTFAYDVLNRLTSTADSRFGQTIQYGYDLNNRRTMLKDPEGGEISYTYDADNNLLSVTNPSRATVHFTYDANHRSSSVKYSNGVTATYQYDAASRLTALIYSGGSTSIKPPSFEYAYDASGNPIAVTDLSGKNAYQFDHLSRLTVATHPKLSVEHYVYDGAGNRLGSTSDSNYTYDSDARLMKAEGFTNTYDNNGNLTSKSNSKGVTKYTYDAENRLTGIAFPDGSTATYEYDALGRRIQKNVKGVVTNYLYDSTHILLELDHAGKMLARYTHGPAVDQMLTMERGGKTYFYEIDRIGSIAAIADSAGKTVCSYSYDSFGNSGACGAVENPFAFAGRELDPESGLYYMRARYYDSVAGRFITSDPLNLAGRLLLAQNGQADALGAQGTPQQLNAYSYAINNPLLFRDPTGLNCNPPVGPPVQLPNGWSIQQFRMSNGETYYSLMNPAGQVLTAGIGATQYNIPNGSNTLVLLDGPFFYDGSYMVRNYYIDLSNPNSTPMMEPEYTLNQMQKSLQNGMNSFQQQMQQDANQLNNDFQDLMN